MTALSYRFRISDAEFRRAWLVEYYRRPGKRALRMVMGPILVAIGVVSLMGDEGFTRVMGGACVALGLWYAVKPLVAARVLTRRRRSEGHADREVAVTIDDEGVEIAQGRLSTRLAWTEVTAAGRGPGYVWYELQGGTRATIPARAIDDPAALEAALRERTEWVG